LTCFEKKKPACKQAKIDEMPVEPKQWRRSLLTGWLATQTQFPEVAEAKAEDIVMPL
jgi:hypothetical protein